jgi:hypothetical protein
MTVTINYLVILEKKKMVSLNGKAYIQLLFLSLGFLTTGNLHQVWIDFSLSCILKKNIFQSEIV